MDLGIHWVLEWTPRDENRYSYSSSWMLIPLQNASAGFLYFTAIFGCDFCMMSCFLVPLVYPFTSSVLIWYFQMP